jgi:ABC-2 type transport system permease protein
VLSGAYMALLGLFGLGLGLVIRNTAGALTAYVGITFLLPVVLQPLQAHGNPGRFAPEQILANSVATVVHQSGQLAPATGFLWMVFYCAFVLIIANMLLARRDA